MTAELIAVGTELLLGNITNTNARDLSIMLSELGIDVYWQTVVGDNPARLRDALELAKGRADIIITTGGLGPTCDDLTKQTIASVFGLELRFDERAEHDIEEFFRRVKAPMTENNRAQAYLPEGCTPFYNTCGTAPGCAFFAEGTHVLMLPGPPREMKAMMRSGGLDYLRSLSDEEIFSHNIHIFGMGESYVESLLRERMNELKNPTLAPYARTAEVRLRVTAKADSFAEAEQLMAPIIAEVEEKLGDVVYGVDTDTLENTVLLLLKERGLTLAAAESCTGGLLAKRMTDLPGASAVFRGGVTVYTNDAKRILLGVSKKTLEEKSAVSREVAEQLAVNVREKLGADFGVGITGVAGPDSDGLHPVGTVFVSLADDETVFVRSLHLSPSFDRERIRITAADHALDMLRRALTGRDVLAGYID
jgi:nicotinamide-nucleotide amidase